MFAYDQRVVSPTGPSNPNFVFNVNLNASGYWTVNSVTIIVDGTAYPATFDPTSQGWSYSWNASQATNPSEHFVSAVANVVFNPPDGSPPNFETWDSTAPDEDGRAADFVIEDLRMAALGFDGSYALCQDAVTPLFWPGIAWLPDGSFSSQPAAYQMSATPGFTIWTVPTTGNAVTGFTCTLDAVPGNPYDPVIQLYSSSVNGSEQVTPYTNNQAMCACQNALNGKVGAYHYELQDLTLYVEFTSTGNWYPVSFYGGPYAGSPGDQMFGLLGQPAAPMATPWVTILDDACSWAYGTTDPTAASDSLTEATYNSCLYVGGTAYTKTYNDTQEDFYLLDFLNGTSLNTAVTGQCNDFADFLCCLSNAIGARPLDSQRSAQWATILAHGPPNGYCQFWTVPITSAPQQVSTQTVQVNWAYHQWAVDGGIFDGSERLFGMETPEDLLADLWHTSLVDMQYDNWWDVQPPFTPNILNNRPK